MTSVYEFVRSCLKDPTGDFHLYIIPPKTTLKADKSKNLRDLGFLPACLIYFGLNEGTQMQAPFLKDSLISEIKEKLPPPKIYIPPVDQSPIIISKPITTPVVLHHKETEGEDFDNDLSDSKEEETKNEKKVPNWFKRGKK
jgi:hypothetical protein